MYMTTQDIESFNLIKNYIKLNIQEYVIKYSMYKRDTVKKTTNYNCSCLLLYSAVTTHAA
jgi:hypothetical protein